MYPKAIYTHCSSHVLNLCIVKSIYLREVSNMMDVASSISRFFSNSPKRQLLLDKYVEQIHSANSEISKRKKLKDLCRTRWVERHNAFEAFWDLYEGIVSCFEEIIEAPAGNWNRDTISNPQSYLRAMTEFRLIITLIITKNLLAYTKGLSIKLQGKWQDIVRAYSNIQSTKLSLEDIRKNIDSFH